MSAEGSFPFDCFLINLDQRPDRLATASRQLAEAGVQAERVPALTGIMAAELGYRVVRSSTERPHWELTQGNVGCASTHLEIYRRIVAGGLPGALILEDDVMLKPDFAIRAQRALSNRRPETNLVQLGWLFEQPRLASRVRDHIYRLVHGEQRDRLAVSAFGYGTHCYWVDHHFAKAAEALFDPIFSPIDAMLRAVTHYSSWECEVHWPSLAGQDDSASDIRGAVGATE